MEQAAPPRRSGPGFGDAVGFFAALLGLALLVATARHLFWSDPLEAGAIATVAVTPTTLSPREPVAQRSTASTNRALPQRSQYALARHDAPRHEVPRHRVTRNDFARDEVSQHKSKRHDVRRDDATRSGGASVAPNDVARTVALSVHPRISRSMEQPQRPRSQLVRNARASTPFLRQRSRPFTAGIEQRPRRVALRDEPPQRPTAHASRQRSGQPPGRARERARQAAIIEPPLGYQPDAMLVELPGAVALDLGRDPIPTLQIRRKHRR